MAEEPKSTHEKEEQDRQQNLEEEEEEDDPKSPPSKVARLSSSSEENPSAGIVTMASPSPLILGLGLGMGIVDSINHSAKPAFTFMQRQELEQQALIFSYMIRGIPVPLNLVLPIWKSVAASYGPHHYPSFVGLGNLCYDFRNSMEPEPGRCRRTDGKKWRCSRDVVPDQKYCERHMHRGRNRSRKPVEAADESTSAVVPASVGATVSVAYVAAPNNNGTTAATATVGCSPISVLSTAVKPVHIED